VIPREQQDFHWDADKENYSPIDSIDRTMLVALNVLQPYLKKDKEIN